MNHFSSFVDRIVTGLIGLILLAAGIVAWAYELGNHRAQSLVSSLDTDLINLWPSQGWWLAAIAGLSALLLIFAILLIRINLPRRPAHQLTVSSSNDQGTVTIVLPPIATALADDFRSLPKVRTASGRLIEDRGIATLNLSVTSSPTCELPLLIAKAEENADELVTATEETGIALRTFLQFDPYRPKRG